MSESTTFAFPCSTADPAEILRDAMLGQGYRIETLNTKAKFIIASLQQRTVIDAYDHATNFHFMAQAFWDLPKPNQATIRLTVKDRAVSGNDAGKTRQECQEQCKLIQQAADDLAKRHDQHPGSANKLTYGNADWASDEQLQSMGWITRSLPPQLPKHDRLLIAQSAGNWIMAPDQATQRHTLVSGPTGSGKTKSIFEPNLFERPRCSMLVTDATPDDKLPADWCEVYQHTARFRTQNGSKLYYFNPADPENSTHINPLQRVRQAHEKQKHSVAKQLASLIIANTSNPYASSDPIWDRAERHLLYSLILHVASDPDKVGSFAHVLDIFIQGVSKLRSVFNENPDRPGRAEYEAFMNNADQRFADNVCSGLMSRLEPWWLPEVRQLTAQTDFERYELAESLFTFYVSVSSLRDDYKLITTVVIDYLLNEFLEIKPVHQYPIAILLDELANLGRLNRLPAFVTTIRKTGISLVFGVQDPIQIEDIYGRARAKAILSQPGTRIYFRPLQIDMAREISMALGKRTLCNRIVRDNGRIEEREEPWPLMTESQIMELSKDEMIVFTPDTRPMKVEKFPWDKYKDKWTTNKNDLPKPVRKPLPEAVVQEAAPKAKKKSFPQTDIAPDPSEVKFEKWFKDDADRKPFDRER